MPRTAPLLALLAAVSAAACQPSAAVLVDTYDLSAAGNSDGDWVGVSEDPDGRRYALHTDTGLFELTENGPALVASRNDLIRFPSDNLPSSDFHDVAALGDERFALVADNDGFLFDVDSGVLHRHFCYLPGETIDDPAGWGPDPVPTQPSAKQVTTSLAYDAVGRRIVAQPRTYDENDGTLLGAHVATFDVDTGLDQQWFDVGEIDLLAGGLAVESSGQVLLGTGRDVQRFDFNTRTLVPAYDLSADTSRIEGMSASSTGTLLVLDADAVRSYARVN